MAKVYKIDKGQNMSFTTTYAVASGTSGSIERGVPAYCVTADGSVAGVVAVGADGAGIVTAQRFVGLGKDVSTETASAAGIVNTWAPVPGMIYRGSPKTANAVDTQSEINALMGKKVLLDLTSTNWTVDTAATDALVNCIVIVGGIPANDEVLFIYSPKGTIFDTSTAM